MDILLEVAEVVAEVAEVAVVLAEVVFAAEEVDAGAFLVVVIRLVAIRNTRSIDFENFILFFINFLLLIFVRFGFKFFFEVLKFKV